MLAVEEFSRRAAIEVGYDGVYQQLTRLSETAPKGSTGLVGSLIEPAGDHLLRSGGDNHRESETWLGERLAKVLPAADSGLSTPLSRVGRARSHF
jgi:hypothetical protein